MRVRDQMIELLAERAQTPLAVKHCVAKVAPKYGDDTSRAFAICTAAKQKGQLKRGHKKDPEKLRSYEKLLAKNRKEHNTVTDAMNAILEKKWIAKAIKKPGALSKELGVPEEDNIPVSKLKKAAKVKGKLGKRARLALTLKKIAK